MTRPRPPFSTIALVLQGGGALGAYQAGVMEGLDEAGITPDWVAGISIGAINAALIAGNAPAARVGALNDFWNTVATPASGLALPNDWASALAPREGPARVWWNQWQAARALVEGQQGFFTPRGPAPWLGWPLAPDQASFYDTAPLKATLERLVDFDRLNHGPMRLSVAAVDVASGNFEVFDSRQGPWAGRIGPEHIMASGALPPGFPAVAIPNPPGQPAGVRHYWDGGLVSNTPLAQVLADQPRRDTLAFQVDLWSAQGAVPDNVIDVQERVKDIQYSSRTRMVTDALAREQRQRRLLRELLAKVPAEQRRHDPWCRAAEQEACGRLVNVVHLIYQDKAWDGLLKDAEFGARTMHDHWASGLGDLRHTLGLPGVLDRPVGDVPGDAFVTHDVHRRLAAAAAAA